MISEPFQCVAVDLVGLLPKGKCGCRFILTYVCLATKWPEAVPLRSGSASEVAEAMMNIFLKVGFPMKVLSDRGKVFLSKVVKQLHEQCGIDIISTSPYRPQSNSVVECLHGTLKPMLANTVNSGIDWVQYLPMALRAIRNFKP